MQYRARVWFTRRHRGTVHYEVYRVSDGAVMLCDNTGRRAWRRILRQAQAVVAALDHMAIAGYEIAPLDWMQRGHD